MCKAAAKYEYTNTQVSSSIESAWELPIILLLMQMTYCRISKMLLMIFLRKGNGKEDDHRRGICLSGLDSF